MRYRSLCSVVASALLVAASAQAQVTKETVPGITNFSRVETTIACAGATTPAAVAEVKRMGYASIINLRLPSEEGANTEAEEAAAKVAKIRYISLPFNTEAPDAALVDPFIAAVTAPANQPVFVHCRSANRVGALWMIKRILVDGWDQPKAEAEATAIGLTNPALRQFALGYVATHAKR